jgi:hypothetical protein
LDLFERHIDARFRDRAYKVENDPATGKRQLVVDNKPLRLGFQRTAAGRESESSTEIISNRWGEDSLRASEWHPRRAVSRQVA